LSLIQRWDRRKGPESSLETGGWPDLAGVSGKRGRMEQSKRRREIIGQYYTETFLIWF